MAATAVVTGASGYVASEIVKQLLEKGYNVQGTVRSTKNLEKVAHLLKLAEALPGTLTLHEADLLKRESFDDVVKGSDVVFHTASPFQFHAEDPQRDLVDPAVLGTENVLSSVIKHLSTVKRVILTSSFAAIVKRKKGPANGKLYTEEDWNDESTLEEGPYLLSKTLAEQAAWRLSKEKGFKLLVVNPVVVMGPILSTRTDATSISMMKAFLEGTSTELQTRLCDVRDVAKAHVRCAELPSAEGRHLVSLAQASSPAAITAILRNRFPQFAFPDTEASEPPSTIDNSKVQKALDITLTPLEETIVDMAVTLIALGIAKPKRK